MNKKMKESTKVDLKYLSLCFITGTILASVYDCGKKYGTIKTEEDIISGLIKAKANDTKFYIMGEDSGRMLKFTPKEK